MHVDREDLAITLQTSNHFQRPKQQQKENKQVKHLRQSQRWMWNYESVRTFLAIGAGSSSVRLC